MTTFKRNNNGRSDTRKDAICTECKGPVNIQFPVRSNTWAFGMAGVRMMLCSVPCRKSYDQKARVTS